MGLTAPGVDADYLPPMAVVVFLRGVNVGGHRRLRPSVLAKELGRLDIVSIGAAGTFVVRKSIARTDLRRQIAKRVPFEVEVTICGAREILRLAADNPFAGRPASRDIVAFVGVMATRRRPAPALPLRMPADGDWCLQVLTREDRFVLGLYRRQMKAIGYLGQLDKLFGAPLTIRNWNTILAIKSVLET